MDKLTLWTAITVVALIALGGFGWYKWFKIFNSSSGEKYQRLLTQGPFSPEEGEKPKINQ